MLPKYVDNDLFLEEIYSDDGIINNNLLSPKITKFECIDILNKKNDIEPNGFDKNLTKNEIINLAIKYNCPLIVKDGNKGKWYLKGKGRTTNYLKSKINKKYAKINSGSIKPIRDGVYCLLLEF